MESFWTIVSQWSEMGQGLFFLVVIGAFFTLIYSLARYMAVYIHGWPPDGKFPDEEHED